MFARSKSKRAYGYWINTMTMKNALHGRPFSGTWGQLIFDEIKVKKDLTFDKGTLEHHGIVNFGKAVRSTMV